MTWHPVWCNTVKHTVHGILSMHVFYHRALDTTVVAADKCKEKHILFSEFKSTVCFCWGVLNDFPTENLVVSLHVAWLTLRRPLVGCMCCVILLWKEKHAFMWHAAKKRGGGSCVGVTMNICAEKMCNGQLCKVFSFQKEGMTWLDLDTDHHSHAIWQWSKLSEFEMNSNQIKYCLTLCYTPALANIQSELSFILFILRGDTGPKAGSSISHLWSRIHKSRRTLTHKHARIGRGTFLIYCLGM